MIIIKLLNIYQWHCVSFISFERIHNILNFSSIFRFFFQFFDSELPKQHPVVVGIQSRYRQSDTIQGNCTSYNSKPVANLTWTINDVPVRLIVVHFNWFYFLKIISFFYFRRLNLCLFINFGSHMHFRATSIYVLKCFHSLRWINCLFI